MATKRVSILSMMIFLLQTIPSYRTNGEESDDIDVNSLGHEIDGLPVISAEQVFNQMALAIDSQEPKDALQDLITQMKDQSKSVAKLTWNGIKFAVFLGRSGTALRAKNESIANQFWNIISSIWNKILSFFNLKKAKIITEREKLFSVETLRELEPFSEDDIKFIIPTLKHTIEEMEEVLVEKHDLLKHLARTSNNIKQKVFDDMNQKIKEETAYMENLKNYLREKEQTKSKHATR